MSLPVIGITMGDAAGVGPEIIAKTLADPAWYEQCRPIVIGDASIMARARDIVGSPPLRELIDLELLTADEVPFGKLSAKAGDAAFRYIERANRLALDGAIDAVCTAPLNKEALHAGGHRLSRSHRDPRGALRHQRVRDDAHRAEPARDPRDHAHRLS